MSLIEPPQFRIHAANRELSERKFDQLVYHRLPIYNLHTDGEREREPETTINFI
jgi:hypothetical protein